MDQLQRARFVADLVFEVERHLGIPVQAAAIPEECPGPGVSGGVAIKAYRAVTQVRLVLEDRRAGAGSRSVIGDVDWPLSTNRTALQDLLTRLFGPPVSASPQGGVNPSTEPDSTSESDSSAVPIAFGVLGTALGGASLGLVAAGLARGGDGGLPTLHADGEAQRFSTISSVAIVGLVLAGSAIVASVVSALVQLD